MLINCPHCQKQFQLDEELSKEKTLQIKLDLEKEMNAEIQKQKDELNKQAIEFNQKKQKEFEEQLAQQKEKAKQEEQLLQEKLKNELGAKLEFLEKQNEQQQLKLKEAQQKEVEILQLQNQLQQQKEASNLELQKALLQKEAELKKIIEESATKNAEDKYVLKIKEYEQKLEQQTKLIDEQKRKMEQGSMETQGEVQENYIKERLQKLFPFDEILDVAKGKRGADLIHNIRNNVGEVCGTIIYESKNTRTWSNDWKAKLLDDVREQKADIGLLISQVLPKTIKSIGNEDGIWICGFNEFDGVAAMLRDGVLKVFESKKSQENKGDKMVMLYDYLTNNEFKQRWEAILMGFKTMKNNIDKQRNSYNKYLSEQEQIINSILINGNSFLGSIKGIAGSGMDEVKMLE